MSDYVFRSYEEMNFGSRTSKTLKSEEKNDKKTFAAKFVFIILSVILAIEAVVYLFVMPCTNAPKIIWKGVETSTIYELSRVAGSSLTRSWMNFDQDEVCSILTTVPGIEDVRIEKSFPDKVTINVTERQAVAVTIVSQNDRTVPVQIDRNGVLFPVNNDDVFDGSSLIISGIPVENIPEGMRIPSKYHPLLQQISEIKAINKNYFAAVSEIHVVPKEYGNYELAIYPVNSRIRILTDRALNEEALQYMMVMVDVVNAMEKNVEEIDLRYGAVSYRTRN